ncbi:DUF6624 domain-containing protein [Mucilaginibacter sp. CSA2-8R]|uniref:DUF6624 domain-containing protein n=1 Tax=Mucilaginibacter sp. CSA2-8R TaxID=3141542 RepID=UPI00315CF3FD
MKKTLMWLIMVLSSPLCCIAQSKSFNQSLADSLAKWAVLDQTAAGIIDARLRALGTTRLQQYRDSVYALNGQRLKGVIRRYGFPGYDLAGKKGSHNFWLMAQHCDKDVPFQRQVLKAMKAELPKHNADPKDYANLTDRVLLNTGQKQLYGTQLTYRTDSCQAIPKPLRDSLSVNTRRKAIGLEPIEANLNWMSQLHFDMNKAAYEKMGIHAPKLLPEHP